MIEYELLTQHVHYHIYINNELLQIYKRFYLHTMLMQHKNAKTLETNFYSPFKEENEDED